MRRVKAREYSIIAATAPLRFAYAIQYVVNEFHKRKVRYIKSHPPLVLWSETYFSRNKTGTRAIRISIPKPENKKGSDNKTEPVKTEKVMILVFLFSLKYIFLLLKL